MLRRWLFWLCLLAMLGGILSLTQPAHAQSPARKGASITVNPASGSAGTQVQVTGSNYSFFCAGYILIDGSNTGTQFQCGSSNSFQATFTWPDGLPDGHHTVTARSVFTDASTGFVQAAPIQPTPTLEPTLTPQASATAGAGGSGGATTSPPNQQGPYTSNLPAVLAFAGLCLSVLVLGVGVVILFLALRRRDARQAAAYPAAYAAPPPPPPPEAPLNPDDPWIWPRDPYAR